ncbi:MAG: hypothetical protein PHH82_01205 [Candidatus ainarchaeum sp.]|nr:hypothetical protein [Candidatus ainarchaeum sp.]
MAYTGPVIFIVHSPLVADNDDLWRNTESERTAKLSHSKLILKLIALAKKRKILLVYGYGIQKVPWFRDLVKDAIPVDLSLSAYLWKEEIKRKFEEHNITPTKFIVGGHYREWCVKNVEEDLRQLFPHTRIIELNGNYTVHHMVGRGIMCKETLEKERRTKDSLGVSRRPLTREVLR